MRITIYKSDVHDAKVILDTQEGTLALSCKLFGGTLPAYKPEDKLPGAYTGGEIAQAWLDDESLTGMSGNWIHDTDRVQENKNRIAMLKWLKGTL